MGAIESAPIRVPNKVDAIPVLPVGLEVKVYSVLVNDNGFFLCIGDLGSLCAEGEGKAFLQGVVAQERSTVVTDQNPIEFTAEHDSEWLERHLLFPSEDSAALNDVHKWDVKVPRHQLASAASETLGDVLDKFVPDTENPLFGGDKALPVWIVTEVLLVPSFEVYAYNANGEGIRFPLAPRSAVPYEHMQITLGGEAPAQQFISVRGIEAGGAPRPFSLAFRGVKCKCDNGILRNPRLAGFEEHARRHTTYTSPADDPDMADFVTEDQWFATVVERVQSA